MIKFVTSAAFAILLLSAPACRADSVVNVAHFGQIALHNGGHVTVVRGDRQSVLLIKGSTQYTSFSVGNGDHLFIYACGNSPCPPHYDLEIEIATPVLNSASVGSGGAIVVDGKWPAQNIFAAAIDSGGSIDAKAISATQVSAAINKGGEISVTATGQLNAAVNNGGSIVYHGNPKVTQVTNGGGSITQAH